MEYDSGARRVGLRNGDSLTLSAPVTANARRRSVIGERRCGAEVVEGWSLSLRRLEISRAWGGDYA